MLLSLPERDNTTIDSNYFVWQKIIIYHYKILKWSPKLLYPNYNTPFNSDAALSINGVDSEYIWVVDSPEPPPPPPGINFFQSDFNFSDNIDLYKQEHGAKKKEKNKKILPFPKA